jgi:hypothetical protein
VGQLEKLAFLRELGAPDWHLEAVSSNPRRQLAAPRRSTTAALAGRPNQLRYPVVGGAEHEQPALWPHDDAASPDLAAR